MPSFTAVTRSGVRLHMVSGQPEVYLDGSHWWTMPAAAQFGIDPAVADIEGGIRAVCIGVGDDLVYLLEAEWMSMDLDITDPVAVSPGQARSSWVDEAGVVSWVPESDPYHVHYLDGRPPTPSLDTKHPAWPVPGVVEGWGPISVTDIQRSGDWEVGSEAFDPNRRVVARCMGSDPFDVWRGVSPKPARIQQHDDGTCTVCVQIPEGTDNPVLVQSSWFMPYRPDPVTVPEFVRVPQRCAVVIDSAPGVPWFLAYNYTVSGSGAVLGILHHYPQDQAHYNTHVNMALFHATPFYAYSDTGNLDDVNFGPDPGIPSLPMLQCYPWRDESDADFEARTRELFEYASHHTAFAVYACGFLGLGTSGERTEQQVVNGLGIVNRMAAEYPKCRIVVVFTHERGDDDGVARFPSLQEAVTRFQWAVPDPFDYPTCAELSEPPVEPEKPPVDPPIPPDPKPFPFEVFLMAMSAPMTLLRSSLFIPSKNAPGRYLYPAPGKPGFYLSLLQDQQGGVTVSATQNDGGGEQFLYERDRGLATIGDSTNPIGAGYPVMHDGEPQA